jgi:hypothetical protein
LERPADREIEMPRLTMLATTAALGLAIIAVASAAAGPVTYTDVRYPDLRGMSVTVPASWRDAQTAGEFAVVAPNWKNGPGTGSRVDFLVDPYGTPGGGPNPQLLPNVHTPAQLVAFLRQNPKLVTSAIRPRMIGGFRALGVDLHLSPDAGKEDPHCPAACWSYLRFAHGCCIGTDVNTYVRLYFATIGHGSKRHVLMAFIQGDPRSAYTNALPIAEKILGTVKLPASLRR